MNIIDILKVYLMIGAGVTFVALYANDEYEGFRDLIFEYFICTIIWPVILVIGIKQAITDTKKKED